MCQSSCDAVISIVPFTDTAWLDQSTDTQGESWHNKRENRQISSWMYQNILDNWGMYDLNSFIINVGGWKASP